MSNSLWIATANQNKPYPPLTTDLTCDVCIIGGGLAGLANAYFLAKEGKSVVVLEKDQLLQGATGNSTGKLTIQQDVYYSKLVQQFGNESAKTFVDVNRRAIDFAKSIASKEILQDADSTLYAQTELGVNKLQQEQQAYEALGIPFHQSTQVELPIAVKSALTITDEAQIHPVRFGQLLAQMAVEAGAQLFEQSPVVEMDLKKRFVITSSMHEVQFTSIILATHYPIEALHGMQVIKLAVSRSYIVAAPTTEVYKGQYLAVDAPKRSVRTATIDDKLYCLLAGGQHTAGTVQHTEPYYEQLINDLQKKYDLSEAPYRWTAQDPETPDLLPYAGSLSTSLPYVFISTGNRKWGLSNSLASARIITDQIVGKTNKAAELYAPQRTKMGALLTRALQLTGLVLKEFPQGHLTRTDAPICTHLGCRTRWNEAEKTWDCPCHGSRFRNNGSVLEGPAMRPLKDL